MILLSGLPSNGSESSTSVSGIISLRADMMLPLSLLQAQETYYVNKYADYHSFEFAI